MSGVEWMSSGVWYPPLATTARWSTGEALLAVGQGNAQAQGGEGAALHPGLVGTRVGQPPLCPVLVC